MARNWMPSENENFEMKERMPSIYQQPCSQELHPMQPAWKKLSLPMCTGQESGFCFSALSLGWIKCQTHMFNMIVIEIITNSIQPHHLIGPWSTSSLSNDWLTHIRAAVKVCITPQHKAHTGCVHNRLRNEKMKTIIFNSVQKKQQAIKEQVATTTATAPQSLEYREPGHRWERRILWGIPSPETCSLADQPVPQLCWYPDGLLGTAV